MKMKKMLVVSLMFLFMGGLAIGIMPRTANAVLCNYSGYVVITGQIGTATGINFRSNPISAGMYNFNVGDANMDTQAEEALFDTLRSAHQNNTKLYIWTNYTSGPTCPTPNLNVAGATNIGSVVLIFDTGDI